MADNKALDSSTIKGIVAFVGDMLLRLEAPARNASTRNTISRVITCLSRADTIASDSTAQVAPLVFDVCMDYFRWVYFKLDQVGPK